MFFFRKLLTALIGGCPTTAAPGTAKHCFFAAAYGGPKPGRGSVRPLPLPLSHAPWASLRRQASTWGLLCGCYAFTAQPPPNFIPPRRPCGGGALDLAASPRRPQQRDDVVFIVLIVPLSLLLTVRLPPCGFLTLLGIRASLAFIVTNCCFHRRGRRGLSRQPHYPLRQAPGAHARPV